MLTEEATYKKLRQTPVLELVPLIYNDLRTVLIPKMSDFHIYLTRLLEPHGYTPREFNDALGCLNASDTTTDIWDICTLLYFNHLAYLRIYRDV